MAKDGDDDVHMLFSSEITEEQIENDNGVAALQSILYDEMTAQERAMALKEQGNESLAVFVKRIASGEEGAIEFVQTAVTCYSKALTEEHDDKELIAVLHGNRAQAFIYAEEFGRALEDSVKCLEFKNNNVKGIFRAAKASVGLGKWKDANHYLNMMKSIDERKLKMVDDLVSEVKPWINRITMLEKKGITFSSGEIPFCEVMKSEDYSRIIRNSLSRKKNLVLPCIILYDEVSQSDIIEEMRESDSISDHIRILLPPEGPSCPWDEDGNVYRFDSVRVTYTALDGKRIEIPLDDEICVGHLLQRGDFVIYEDLLCIALHIVPKIR